MTKIVFSSLDTAKQGFALLDLVPDTHAWIKSTEGLFLIANRLFFERFGFSSLQGLLGKSDYDLAPRHLADKYCGDDTYVLGGGEIIDRLELIPGEGLSGDWFLTSKWPVYNTQEQIIGSLGISRHLNKTEGKALPYSELRAPIDYIYQNFASDVSIDSLATACNISRSALERRFKKHLKKTPHQYVTDVRLDNARRLLLETEKSIGTIALETGFADHSHFTRSFTKSFGMAPGKTRKLAVEASE